MGRENIWQVSEPSAQFSCENETSLENVIKEEERKKPPGHSYLCSLQMKIPSKTSTVSCLFSPLPFLLTDSLTKFRSKKETTDFLQFPIIVKTITVRMRMTSYSREQHNKTVFLSLQSRDWE